MLKTALFIGSGSLPLSADDFLSLLASCKGNRASLIKYDANLKVRAHSMPDVSSFAWISWKPPRASSCMSKPLALPNFRSLLCFAGGSKRSQHARLHDPEVLWLDPSDRHVPSELRAKSHGTHQLRSDYPRGSSLCSKPRCGSKP